VVAIWEWAGELVATPLPPRVMPQRADGAPVDSPAWATSRTAGDLAATPLRLQAVKLAQGAIRQLPVNELRPTKA
jgi:hypothetical protein